MPRRPCIEGGCPHLALPGKARCPTHQQQREYRRGTRQQRGYDASYEQARRALHLELHPPCYWCGAPATTADHYPPLVTHPDTTYLVPACQPCNSGRVALKRWNEQ